MITDARSRQIPARAVYDHHTLNSFADLARSATTVSLLALAVLLAAGCGEERRDSGPAPSRRVVLLGFVVFLAAAVVGGLIPLPLVLALNALFVATVHTLLIMVGLPTIASYVVVSYAAGLVFALGATYAAIPVLAERSAGPRLLPLA